MRVEQDAENMVLKLYKNDEGTMLYWEAWVENDEVIVHFGELGQIGETTNIPLAEFEPPETAVLRHAEEARQAGFAEIDHEDLFELIVQYPIKNGDTAAATQLAGRVEDILSDVLGWSGLGHCDSHDFGMDTLNIFCYVVNPRLAVDPIVQALKDENLLDEAIVAFQDKDENFEVLWPSDWQGVFDYF